MNKMIIGFLVVVSLIFLLGIYVYSDCILFACPRCEINKASATAYATFVGGLLSGFSVILLLLTLNHQDKQEQKDEINKRFTLMLEMHKNNVEELSVTSAESANAANGKRAIDSVIEDFIRMFQDVKKFRGRKQNCTTEEKADDIEFAYDLLYFGIGQFRIDELWKEESGLGQKALNAPPPEEFLSKLKESFNERERFAVFLYEQSISDSDDKADKLPKWKSSFYANFTGYHNQLGHYFRHLFNMISYVDSQVLFTKREKYDLVKMLRTQLTNNEQKLIFLNAFFKYGKKWELKHRGLTQKKSDIREKIKNKLLITNYKLIKNLPGGAVFEDIFAENFFPDIEFEDPED